MSWTKVTDVRTFLQDNGTKRVREHSFTGKVCHWPYCVHCGLLLLKNQASRKASGEKCVTWE